MRYANKFARRELSYLTSLSLLKITIIYLTLENNFHYNNDVIIILIIPIIIKNYKRININLQYFYASYKNV